MHTGASFIFLDKVVHIGEIQFRINSVGIHIERKRDDVNIARSFTVAEECTLNSVCSCKKCQFRCCNAGSSVIMWMYA